MFAAVARWLGDKRWVRPVARRILPPVDRSLVRWGLRATPWPTLNLTTVGRASGKHRTVPLYFVEHRRDLAVIATNFGGSEPQWSRNLRREPGCRVQLGRRQSWPATARCATSEEWQELFDRFAAFYPPYRGYAERAGRNTPVWVLSRDGS